jgi:hypothetical protein
LLALYAVAVFANAALLFTVELLFGKLVLPHLGGTAAVWGTCMMFYQGALLAGYLYAHMAIQRLGTRRAAVLQLAVLAAACAVLPVEVARGWSPPSTGTPVLWLLGLLTVSLGLPFFALSAGAPLLQRWYADAVPGADPYPLYAASNAGALVALVAYPALIEPSVTLSRQAVGWTAGFIALLIVLVFCAIGVWRSPHHVAQATTSPAVHENVGPAQETRRSEPDRGWSPGEIGRWLLLSAVPSSLLLSVTSYLTTDVAPLPMLWVVPLGLYLLTYIVAFGIGARRIPTWFAAATRLTVIPLMLITAMHLTLRMTAGLVLHLVAFVLVALLCHAKLAATRPPVERLTAYYTWISAGGLLGSAVNVLIAPTLFNANYEYPLALVAGLSLAAAGSSAARGHAEATASLNRVGARQLGLDVMLGLAIAVGLAVLWWVLGKLVFLPPLGRKATLLIVAAVALLAAAERPRRSAVVGLSVLAALLTLDATAGEVRILERARSFYGTYTVQAMGANEQEVHKLVHGSTVHGVQRWAAGERTEPLSYYARSGPIGDAFAALPARVTGGRIASVGLGAGSLACYSRPGSRWTFYEIDPEMLRIARDTTRFSYLANCAPSARVVLGDARLALARTPDAGIDLLILDAFTSDAIPVHLLTREAFQLYAAKLASGGVLLVHVSNRYLDLLRLVAGTSREASLVGITRTSAPSSAEMVQGVTVAQWIALAAKTSDLGSLRDRSSWQPLPASQQLWTDDFSNLLSVIRR